MKAEKKKRKERKGKGECISRQGLDGGSSVEQTVCSKKKKHTSVCLNQLQKQTRPRCPTSTESQSAPAGK